MGGRQGLGGVGDGFGGGLSRVFRSDCMGGDKGTVNGHGEAFNHGMVSGRP